MMNEGSSQEKSFQKNSDSYRLLDIECLTIERDGKPIKLWGTDHLEGLNDFVSNCMNTEFFEKKLEIYENLLKIESNDEAARLYIVMVHQLYFEILEYFVLLLKAFSLDKIITPYVILKTSTEQLKSFAKIYIEDERLVSSPEGGTSIISRIVSIVKTIYEEFPLGDAEHKDLIHLSLFQTVRYSLMDFLDANNLNSYNSIKHGNRGKHNIGKWSLSSEEGEVFDVVDTDYSFDHYALNKFDKKNLYIQKISTIFDSSQLIGRIKCVLGVIQYIHGCYFYQVLKKMPNKISIVSFDTVELHWTGLKNSGHIVIFNMNEFRVDKLDVNKAQVLATIDMELKISSPRKYIEVDGT